MNEGRRLAAGEAILSEAATAAPSREKGQERGQDDALDQVLENLVRQHSRLVYRIAYAVLRRHHDAEDATQETFVRVLRYSTKLDVFPSPQPLSEQEKMLQDYVADYPEQARLVARALTEALRPDQLKGMAPFPSGGGVADSVERNNDTVER